jgi:magnesium-transporting ATPase (P-type)
MVCHLITVPHSKPANDVLAQAGSSEHGLHSEEVKQRLQQYGLNTLPKSRRISAVIIFFRQFLDPLIYILLAAAVVSITVGKNADAIFIFAVLLLNAIIGAIQEYSAQRSASSLQSLVTRNARVLRNSEAYEIRAEELVPGDIILLESGDKVPADARLIHSQDLHIDESLLSGESLPVAKDANTLLAVETIVAEQQNMAFSGTLVSRGRATAVVTATALATELGHIAEDVLQGERVRPPLVQRMERFTFRMSLIMLFVISLLAVVSLLQGMALLEVFVLSVALAVAAIPEGLPVAMTVALAISIRRMAKRNVIARRLVTVEALGSCTFIASDKTGTLTRNEISACMVALPLQEAIGLAETDVVEEPHRDAYLQSIPDMQREGVKRLATAMMFANEGFLGHRNGSWVKHGDSVDTALLVFAQNMGLVRAQALLDSPLLMSIPFESATRYSASLHNYAGSNTVFVKGAVESLIGMCSHMAIAEADEVINPDSIMQQARALAAEGYRVLAAAQGTIATLTDDRLNHEDLRGLTFLGLVGMIDPLRDESRHAVEQCQAAGINVAMLTGDHPLTAYAIARSLGFVDNPEQVITSSRLIEQKESGADFDNMLRDTRVYARLEPHQKLDIVSGLQKQGHFVAVTGDGANDAPALRAAHVGVAMGKSGTDVARETADIILVDDNFASIVAGVEEGRIAYANVRKVIHLLISTGAAEIVLFMLSLLAGLPIPLTAVQLLWLNLVTNGIQDVALAFEPSEGNELRKPPRAPDEAVFNRVMIQRVLLAAVVMGTVAFVIFYFLLGQGLSVEAARNGTLLLMVLFENVHVFNSRSETRSVFMHNPLRNPILLLGTLAAQTVHIAAMFTPGLSSILEISPVTLHDWTLYLCVSMSLLFASEVYKWFYRRSHPD